MLLSAGRRNGELPTVVDSIHNYYEHLVLEEIHRINERSRSDAEFFADCACVALNRLPPRYIRHDVDMTFFLSPVDQEEINKKVRDAAKEAVEYVNKREVERDANG
jgi:hypothetical protein